MEGERALRRAALTAYFFVIPALISILLIDIYPMLSAMVLSVYDFTFTTQSEVHFVGLKNFYSVLADAVFLGVLQNTIFFTVATVGLSLMIGLLIALILNEPFRGNGVLRTLALIPWIAPPVAISIIWRWMLSLEFGPFSDVLVRLGLPEVSWLGDLEHVIGPISIPLITVIVVNAWNFCPFVGVSLLAGLKGIPIALYESATVDGASYSQRLRYITLPSLKPVFGVVTILLTLWNFMGFNINYLLTRGGPGSTTTILSVLVYTVSFSQGFDMSKGATIGVLMLLMILPVVLLYIRQVLKEIER